MGRIISLFLVSFVQYLYWHVNSTYGINLESTNKHISKRDILQKLDKASYSFNGFQKVSAVPVLFPLDICLMDLKGITYVTTLHINKNGMRHFEVYKNINSKYEVIATIPTPLAISLDCQSFSNKGYVTLAYKMIATNNNTKQAYSPLYEIYDNTVKIIQLFSTPSIRAMLMIKTTNNFFMLQLLKNTASLANLQCPYYIWQDKSFNPLGSIPCTNALHLEPFIIDEEVYIAVANYGDQYGRTDTDSEIYKFNEQMQEFKLFQRIRTKGAVHIKHFQIPFNEGRERKYFLIFGNSIPNKKKQSYGSSNADAEEPENLEADSIIYNFENDVFVPHQKLSFYEINQFLPIESSVAENFLLLVACNNQDIKIFNLKDWTFEESDIQFTQGAFGRGVSHMRVFNKRGNTYLVVANRFMLPSEANIFLPIFKQDEEANQLRLEIMQWAQANTERLINIDVKKLKQDVERKLTIHSEYRRYMKITDISQSHIANVTTKSLIYPPLQIGSGYWRVLSLAKQALDILEENLQSSTVRTKRSADEPHAMNYNNSECRNKLECLHVETLIIKDKIKARKINGFDVDRHELESITANKIIVTGKYDSPTEDLEFNYFPALNVKKKIQPKLKETIKLNNLHITGKLNEYTWDELVNNTLKRRVAIQFLKAPVRVKNLTTKAIAITNNIVSGKNLAKLISIDNGGSYVVNQDVKFIQPITAKNVIVNERLNNIHISNRKFDVLLRNSNETQVIEGAKTCENIRILEPIKFLSQILGNKQKRLGANPPVKVINDIVSLNGNYVIAGNVRISKLLTADDIIIAKTNTSAQVILKNGINVNEPLENIDMHFHHPIVANDSTISFINAHDLQQLIKVNTNEVQIVDGKKTFNSKLEIKGGFSEVKILNNINMEELEKHLFLRDTNQTITVPMHFGKIMMKGLNATQLKLNSLRVTDYLTKSGTQRIQGTMKVDDLIVNTLVTKDLHSNEKIFGIRQAEIYEQKAQGTPHPNIFRKGHKFRGTIYVRNLKTNSSINDRFVDQLERQLQQLKGDIKYMGDLKFNRDIRIPNLSFLGTFNGIPAKEFGYCWLQKYGEQTFIASQTIASVKCENGLDLFGKLNGYRMEDFVISTYWINRDEYIPHVIFENPIKLQGALFSGTVNKMLIPQDIIYRTSAQTQIISQSLTVEGDLFVTKRIHNTTLYNGLNLLHLCNYLKGYGCDTLYIENAIFTYSPQYKTLNYYYLQGLLNSVWLANENVDLQQHVEIVSAHFEGLLEFEGPINNVNLKYLKENYFSLSRAQTISADILIANTTSFEDDFYANEMKLFGQLIDSKSQSRFSIDKFVTRSLKKAGPQIISQYWYLPEAKVQGDLHNVRVNKLNLATDVVRLDIPLNEIIAPKNIKTASITKLYATPESLVNNVNSTEWIRRTVFVYENHTIHGNTILDTVNIFNDLQVEGFVNNIIFNENTLLLAERKQVLHGPVIIRNKFLAEQRILTNNIENLHTEFTNDWNVEEFYTNQAKLSPVVNLQGSLVFTNPLTAAEYRTGENIARDKRNTNTDSVYETISESISHQNYILHDFEVRQIITINATKLFVLPLHVKGHLMDAIQIILKDSKEKPYHFYIWNATTQQYLLNQNFSWLLNEPIEILSLALKKDKYLLIADGKSGINKIEKVVINDMESVKMMQQINVNNSWQIERFQMWNNDDCFAFYAYASNKTLLYCVSKSNLTRKSEIIKPRVKQILALTVDMVGVLSDDAVEIWNASLTKSPIQRFTVFKPKQIAVNSKNQFVYLAVVSEVQENSLHNGIVELYRSTNNSMFIYVQTINCNNPLRIEFAVIPQTADLLLYILSDTYGQSLTVHQYKGVVGFVQIVTKSILPTAFDIQTIGLRSGKHLTALLSKNTITFIEILLKVI